jgi:hypothetical protein
MPKPEGYPPSGLINLSAQLPSHISIKENSTCVVNFYFAEALILISTPAGKLNLFNASIVLAVA